MAEPAPPPKKEEKPTHKELLAVLYQQLDGNLKKPPHERIAISELYQLSLQLTHSIDGKTPIPGFEQGPEAIQRFGLNPEAEYTEITRYLREAGERLEKQKDWNFTESALLSHFQADPAEVKHKTFAMTEKGLEDAISKLRADKPAAPAKPAPAVKKEPDIAPLQKLKAQRAVIVDLLRAAPEKVSSEQYEKLIEQLRVDHGPIFSEKNGELDAKIDLALRFKDPKDQAKAMGATALEMLDTVAQNKPDEVKFTHTKNLQAWMEESTAKLLTDKTTVSGLVAKAALDGADPLPMRMTRPKGEQKNYRQQLKAINNTFSEIITLTPKALDDIDIRDLSGLISRAGDLARGPGSKYAQRLDDATEAYTDPADLRKAKLQVLQRLLDEAAKRPNDDLGSVEMRNFQETAMPVLGALAGKLELAQKFVTENEKAAKDLPRPPGPAPGAKRIEPAERIELINRVIQRNMADAIKTKSPQEARKEIDTFINTVEKHTTEESHSTFRSMISKVYEDGLPLEKENGALLAQLDAFMKNTAKTASPSDAFTMHWALEQFAESKKKTPLELVLEEKNSPLAPPSPPSFPAVGPTPDPVTRAQALEQIIAKALGDDRGKLKLDDNKLSSLEYTLYEMLPKEQSRRFNAEAGEDHKDVSEERYREIVESRIRRAMKELLSQPQYITHENLTDIQKKIYNLGKLPGDKTTAQDRIIDALKNPSRDLPDIPASAPRKGSLRLDDISGIGMALGVLRLSTDLDVKQGGLTIKDGWKKIGTPGKDGAPTVITYTFDSKTLPITNGAGKEYPLTSQDGRYSALEAMQSIQKVANVVFIEAPPGKENSADLHFGQAYMLSLLGYSDMTTNGKTSVILSRSDLEDNPKSALPGGDYFGTTVHEVLHAMGISHPFSSETFGKQYSTHQTVMSYSKTTTTNGLSPFDVAALRHHYGPAKGSFGDKKLRLEDLPQNPTLQAKQGTFTLDLRGEKATGELAVNLSTGQFEDQLAASLMVDGKPLVADNRIQPGTKLDIATDDKTAVTLKITGAAKTEISGGGKSDMLTAQGGANVLRGRGGADVFVFNAKSGMDNRVEDFSLSEKDRILITPDIEKVELKAGKAGSTQMLLYSGGTLVASVDFKNASPDDLKKSMSALSTKTTLEGKPISASAEASLPVLPPPRPLPGKER